MGFRHQSLVISLEEEKMFQVLEGSEGNVLGVEISGEYTKENVEELEKIFQGKVAEGHNRLNLLFKIDNLNIGKIVTSQKVRARYKKILDIISYVCYVHNA